MEFLYHLFCTAALLALSLTPLWQPELEGIWTLLLPVLGVVWLIVFHLRPRRGDPGLSPRLRGMLGGYTLLLCGSWAVFGVSLILLARLLAHKMAWSTLLWTLFWAFLVLGSVLLNGFFRVLVGCNRLRLVWRATLLLFWWVPILNIFLLWKALRLARAEYRFALARQQLETVHAENQDCATRYPLVLVHGIFFRDWQLVNYWGRIPQALQRSGAVIYYGSQQSSAPIARSGAELKERIEAILAETGAEKVNIIAHSKGGLDSRYAISRLGMGDKVASLTTVNTPHRGVIFGQELLRFLPKGLMAWVDRHYNNIFRALGDAQPDFLGGVNDLTAQACARFNEETPDVPGVLYQSFTSVMPSARSAPFPLNFTYGLVKHFDKEENDGLVTLSSARWGTELGVLKPKGRRGISHGDVVDLMREDIDGFDVRELYTGIVKGLKEQGL